MSPEDERYVAQYHRCTKLIERLKASLRAAEAERAYLVAEVVAADGDQRTFREAGELLGITGARVGTLYSAHYRNVRAQEEEARRG